jgi:ubiquitin-protein ligase
MNKTAIRIMNDYIDFIKNKPEGMYLWIDQQNIYQQYALIMGPPNTPYFGGYFFF